MGLDGAVVGGGVGEPLELGRGREQAELVSDAGLSYLLKQAGKSLSWCSESVTVCLSAQPLTQTPPPPPPPYPELAEFWASFPGLRAFDSAPSLPTAELAQELTWVSCTR